VRPGLFAQKRIFGAPEISSLGNLSERARGSARSETGMRIVSDWLVNARGVGLGDGEAELEGDGELVTLALSEGDGVALLVASADAVGVGEDVGVADAVALGTGSGVPPESSSARVGPTFAKMTAIRTRSKRRKARVFALRGFSSK